MARAFKCHEVSALYYVLPSSLALYLISGERFLHQNGCDINSLNQFGCNALLWCSQGAATPEIFSWLHSTGADFTLVNDNGHSALHKAAQRGNASACKWLVDMYLHKPESDVDGQRGNASACKWLLLIGPDAEGACPSDLCGMNGHENLAKWLSKQECDFVQRIVSPMHLTKFNTQAHASKCRKICGSLALPSWLRDSQCTHQSECGISKMRDVLLRNKSDTDQHIAETIKSFRCSDNMTAID